MNENEMKLIGMIRESDDPEKAMMVAVEVITSYLRQHGSSGGQAPADLPVLVGTS